MIWSRIAVAPRPSTAAASMSAGAWAVGVDWRHWIVLSVGLGIGVMARWAIMLSLNQRVGWRELRIDALIILANGLLATQFAEAMNLQGSRLALAAAMFGASSTMIFAKAHAAFIATQAERGGIIAEVGPSNHGAVPAKLHVVTEGSALTPTDLLIESMRQAGVPDDPAMDKLMRKLGEDDDRG